MLSGGTAWLPNAATLNALPAGLSSMALIALEPISRPTRDFDLPNTGLSYPAELARAGTPTTAAVMYIGRSRGQVGYHEGAFYQNRQFCALLAAGSLGGGSRDRQNCNTLTDFVIAETAIETPAAPLRTAPADRGRCLDNPPIRRYPLGLPSFERGRPPSTLSSASVSRPKAAATARSLGDRRKGRKGFHGFVCPHRRHDRPAVARD